MTVCSPVTPFIQALADKHGQLLAREILCAWAGLKSARVGVASTDLQSFTQIVECLGLAWRQSKNKYIGRRDTGKGGWANKFAGTVPASAPQGNWLIYVAREPSTAEAARAAEEDGREFDFGSSLGIPHCCANFYLKYQKAAYAKQNDFVQFVLDETAGAPPYNFLLNYVTQYFGYALISFFPCSFKCRRAASVAQRTLDLMQRHAPQLALETMRLQKCSVLYTEYRGVYLFEKSSWDEKAGKLRYDPNAIRGTLPPSSAVLRKLRAGQALGVESKHAATVVRNAKVVAALRGENVSICLF